MKYFYDEISRILPPPEASVTAYYYRIGKIVAQRDNLAIDNLRYFQWREHHYHVSLLDYVPNRTISVPVPYYHLAHLKFKEEFADNVYLFEDKSGVGYHLFEDKSRVGYHIPITKSVLVTGHCYALILKKTYSNSFIVSVLCDTTEQFGGNT